MEQSFLNAIEKNVKPVPVSPMRVCEEDRRPLNFTGGREVVCVQAVVLSLEGVFDGQTPLRAKR